MKIAIINEVSAVAQNAALVSALEGRGHTIINAGMKTPADLPELTYIHTGFQAALLLNSGRADFIVGGCGTGEGFLISVTQYPNIFCGHITNDLDAWLFAQINGGNCVSLPLLYGYGWAGDANLKFIFDRLFSVQFGIGYPEHRRDSQKKSRTLLAAVSRITHRKFSEIVDEIDEAVIRPVLEFPGFLKILDIGSLSDEELKKSLKKRVA